MSEIEIKTALEVAENFTALLARTSPDMRQPWGFDVAINLDVSRCDDGKFEAAFNYDTITITAPKANVRAIEKALSGIFDDMVFFSSTYSTEDRASPMYIQTSFFSEPENMQKLAIIASQKAPLANAPGQAASRLT